jgi:hypothetical protein
MKNNAIGTDVHVRKHLEQISCTCNWYTLDYVSAEVLRHQSCEDDENIASVLMHCVGDRLAGQMERIAEVIGELEAKDIDRIDIRMEDSHTSSCP